VSDVVVLGTDTGVGKTTFSLLWLAAFGGDYWKPVETGDSDTDLVRRQVPSIRVHEPVARFRDAVAPGLAARREGRSVPRAADLLAAKPEGTLLIESFGSPFSPLNEEELQIQFLRQLRGSYILVGSSAVGAVGRVLQCLRAIRTEGIVPAAIVLIGPEDPYAEEMLRRFHPEVHSFGKCEQREKLETIRRATLRALPVRIVERDAQSIWHPYTSLQDPDPPLEVVDAQHEFLILADGRRVIDAISSWWTVLQGHRHPVLMQALFEASGHFDHVHFAGVTHRPAVELAELMLATMSWKGGRVFFSDNGSTAVEVALKMAYQYWCHRGEPQRTCFVGFEGGYHGDTFGAMSVGRDPIFFGRFEPLLFEAERIHLSPDALGETLRRREVAAVIIEPLVQGAGGMRMHELELLRQLYETALAQDVLFIADEVMTGGGRTGTLWAHQAAGISPDLVCAGKTLAGGVLPLAATLAAPRIVAAWETSDPEKTFFHGHSFTAHPLACAVAVANWWMLSEGVGPAPARMERFWNERFALLRGRPGVRDVRVRGTIAAIELETEGGYLSEVRRRLRRACLDRGVLVRPLGNVLYAMPPFCTSLSSMDRIASAFSEAVEIAIPGYGT